MLLLWEFFFASHVSLSDMNIEIIYYFVVQVEQEEKESGANLAPKLWKKLLTRMIQTMTLTH